MLSAVIALGAGGGASAMASSGLGITLSFVSGFISRGMVAAAELIFAFAMVGSADVLGIGSAIAKGVRNLFALASGAVSTVILGSISVSAALSVAKDSLGLRAARYAISSAVPMVGNAVSGSLGALISGVRQLSSLIGAIGSAALLSTFLLPIITLFGYKITLGACSILCVFTGANHAGRLFSSLSLAVDSMIAALALSATLYILELTSLAGILKGGL
jgi:stage III sporulation protein AE